MWSAIEKLSTVIKLSQEDKVMFTKLLLHNRVTGYCLAILEMFKSISLLISLQQTSTVDIVSHT